MPRLHIFLAKRTSRLDANQHDVELLRFMRIRALHGSVQRSCSTLLEPQPDCLQQSHGPSTLRDQTSTQKKHGASHHKAGTKTGEQLEPIRMGSVLVPVENQVPKPMEDVIFGGSGFRASMELSRQKTYQILYSTRTPWAWIKHAEEPAFL